MVRQVDPRRGLLLLGAFLCLLGFTVVLNNFLLSFLMFSMWALGVEFGKYER